MLKAPKPNRILARLLLVAMTALTAVVNAASEFDAALAGAHRSAENRARDAYRHPAETLAFFGIKPDMVVVEMWPGGGWYTEVLAPYLHDHGKLVAAHFPENATDEYYQKGLAAYKAKLAAAPELYGRIMLTALMPPDKLEIAPAGSADAVLTFRNVHNWMDKAGDEDKVMLAAWRALIPGGVFGVVEHRATPGATREQMIKTGYTTEELVIKSAESVGFVLEAKSEINANPLDTHDHPEGVWTLLPSLALGDKDRAKYVAIGESDRMTLRFRKPAKK